MTEKINDGGPAYPCKTLGEPRINGIPTYTSHAGMTLRDKFAAAALTGFIMNADTDSEPTPDDGAKVSRWCFFYADAMLKQREVKQ